MKPKKKMSLERALLLKYRYAGRYDTFPTVKATQEEATEEQKASLVRTYHTTVKRLLDRGLIAFDPQRGVIRLTDKGRAKLVQS